MTKKFAVTHYKGVREIELTPEGALVVIAGGNGAGKSSFIDAITELFDPRGSKLTPKPIHDGASEAVAEYVDEDLELKIRRVWKKDGTAGTLTVEALDGARYSKPADVVAQLTGGAIFDPVSWLNLDEKRQREALLEKVDLPFDLDELAREKAGAEDRRRDAGREVKRLQGALESMTPPAADTPDKEVSAAGLIEQIREAQELERRAEDADRRITDAQERVSRAELALAEAKEALEEAHFERNEVPPQDEDIDALQADLARVDEVNAAVRAKASYEATKVELSQATDAQAAEQEKLDQIEQTKRDGLEQATFPIPGLSVDETGVTFDGVPFSQVNSAHRMRAAFGIATAGDPKLKLVIVRNGDLLDAESLDALKQIAEERGYTALVERDRDESRKIGFTIKDGELE